LNLFAALGISILPTVPGLAEVASTVITGTARVIDVDSLIAQGQTDIL
jgi:hypothetical protein